MEPEEAGGCFVCHNENCLLCENCKSVLICHAHQHLHLDADYKTCFPVKIATKKGIGRCLVAIRDIKPGRLVIHDLSAASGPRTNQQKQPLMTSCVSCHLGPKTAGSLLQTCKCGLLLCQFCSKHDPYECQLWQNSGLGSDQVELLAPLRLWLAANEDRDLASRLDLLMDHNDDITDLEELEQVQKSADLLTHLVGDGSARADFARCLGLLKTNSVEVYGGQGRAIFPTFSFISHSCTNNARHVVLPHFGGGFQIYVYAQVLIKKGEEVTITYTNLLRSTFERRAKLEHFWHFTCTCNRCQDPTELGTHIGSVKCPKCDSVMQIELENATYNCCQTAISEATVASLIGHFWELLSAITIDPAMIKIEDLEEFLETSGKVLHPNHYMRLIAKRYLTQLLPRGDARKVVLCQEVLAVFHKLDPGLSFSRGMTLFELFKATQNTEILQEILECLKMEPKDSLGGKAYLQTCKYLDQTFSAQFT